MPQSCCQVAVKRIDVTPPVGIYHRMWGAAAHDRSTGVHRPLTATVMVLEGPQGEAEPRWITIALDHCLLWHQEMERLLDEVAQKAGVPREQLTVFFSHTHAAGLMGSERAELPGGELIEPYLQKLAADIGSAIVDAASQMQPATIVYGVGRCDLARNRDLWDEDRQEFVCGFNPSGVADDTVVVGRVASAGNETLATIVNYACHPTTLAWDNTEISPDYPGAMREVVEGHTGAPCFFIQGASGDIGPRDGFVGDHEVADRNGRQLGYAVLSTLESLLPPGHDLKYTGAVVSGATIGTWAAEPSPSPEHDVFRMGAETVELSFRTDMLDSQELLTRREQYQQLERESRDAGDTTAAGEARAMAERMTRRLAHLEHLPTGESVPYTLTVYRIGQALWIPLDGEHYNVLQRRLRDLFPDWAIIVGTLANGSDVWYLPDAESYGKGLYQEEASVLARGSLERLIDTAASVCRRLVE